MVSLFFTEPWDDARTVENFGYFRDPTRLSLGWVNLCSYGGGPGGSVSPWGLKAGCWGKEPVLDGEWTEH